jgi:hypothetical protein
MTLLSFTLSDCCYSTYLIHSQDIEKPHKLLKKSNEELQRLAAVESLVEVSAEENVSNFNNIHSKHE